MVILNKIHFSSGKPTQEEFVRSVREREIRRIHLCCRIAYIGGSIYLLTGTLFAHFFPVAAGAILWILVPFFFPCVLFFIRVWPFPYVRCQHCGKRCLLDFSAPGAIAECWECGEPLFRVEEVACIALPQLPRAKVLYCGLFMGVAWAAVALQILCRMTPEELGGSVWEAFLLAGAIFAVAMLILLLPDFHACWIQKCPEFPKCPVCDELFQAGILKYTGRCSTCASVIDPEWPPDAPECDVPLPTRVDWIARKKYRTQMILPALLFIVPGYICMGVFLFGDHSFSYVPIVIGVVWFVTLIVFIARMEKKERRIVKNPLLRCPFCKKRINGRLCFWRCPRCRRKLVLDDEKGVEQ